MTVLTYHPDVSNPIPDIEYYSSETEAVSPTIIEQDLSKIN